MFDQNWQPNTRRPPLPHNLQNRAQPPRSPSPRQPCPREPRRTRLPPCPRRRTSGQRRAWRTSDRTCGPTWPRLQRWLWCWRACRLRAALALDGGDGGVDILGHYVAAVEHAAGHVLAVPWVTLHHGIGWLEAGVGDLCDAQGLMVCLLGRDNGRVSDEREVDPGVGNQVGLELVQVHVQRAVKPQGGGDGGDDLADQPIQVGVAWPLYVEISSADIVDRLIVDHERAVAVLESCVRAQGGVVGLHHGGGYLRSWVDAELQHRLLPVVNRQALHQERGEPRTGATAEGMEDKKALKSGAVVGQLPHPVQHEVDDLLADGVVATSIVVGGVLLARHHLLRVEQLLVGPSPDLVDDGGLKVEEDCPWDVLASASFAEEGGERVILRLAGFDGGDLTIRLDPMLHTVELPASITHLDTSLANMDGDAFPHLGVRIRVEIVS